MIGAGAVVTRDVAPYAVVAGYAARPIRYRFDNETIERLLSFKWWDLLAGGPRRVAAPFNTPEESFRLMGESGN